VDSRGRHPSWLGAARRSLPGLVPVTSVIT
jgi:hypothetical protein